mgnify:FL=1|jgi:hypothetical protein
MDLLMQSAGRLGLADAYSKCLDSNPELRARIEAGLEEQVKNAYWRAYYTECVVGSLNKLIELADKTWDEAVEAELSDLMEQCEEAEEEGEEPPFDRWDTANWARFTREISDSCDVWYKDNWVDWLGEVCFEEETDITMFFVAGTMFGNHWDACDGVHKCWFCSDRPWRAGMRW